MKSLYRKLWHLRFAELLLFFEACLLLIAATLVKNMLPFRWYAWFLGNNVPGLDDRAQGEVGIERILPLKNALQRGSCYLPLECKCLVNAIAGKAMLKRRRIPSAVYLGVAKNGEGSLDAHAWLKAGKHLVTGAAGMERFKSLAAFSDYILPHP